MSDMIFVFQKVFKYLSYLMGLFSVILLANFMSTSVMNKKRDIGILRALGARGKDVSKIFLNEASVIGAITTLFSCLGMALLTSIVNATLRDSFLRMFRNEAVNNLTLLTLSLTPFAIVIFMSALLVHAATIIPARKISQMRPVDAIKKA
jgi:ABC-type lipoprotein release transport system permease subunit